LSPPRSFLSRLLGAAKVGFGVAALTALLFVFVEGASSILLLTGDLRKAARRPPTERIHTRYDPLLGWANIPGIAAQDLYGPSRGLRINSQGFRDSREFGVHVPAGKIRIVCLGDSFTLGYGVDDDHTWCHLLAAMDPRIETVNMGQGGYGLDQAYLWYARDGVKLDHDVLIFAFITEDFRRMQRKEFLGYGKPILRIRNDGLEARNVPVPRRSYYFPWLTRNAPLFRKLKTLELLERLLGTASPTGPPPDLPGDPETWKVALKIFDTLHATTRVHGGLLALVSLPDAADYQVDKSDHWRGSLRSEAGQKGFVFLDLVDEIRKLPADEVPGLYDYHFNEKGNQWVARALYEKLTSLPEVQSKLAERGGTPPP